MQNYIAVLKKYVEFNGRASRTEYWMFFLVTCIISIVLSVVDGALHLNGLSNLGVLGSIYSLLILLPYLGVMVRRLHDTNHSGWWVFIILIPLLGALVLLVFLVSNSTPGDNKYGPNPKGVGATPMPPLVTTV